VIEFIQNEEGSELDVVVIISDWLMPGMKGDELLLEISSRWPTVRQVMLTGYANQPSIEKAKEQGNLRVVVSKPWEKEDLIGAIELARS